LAHGWPGNVRELEHVVERAVLMCQGDQVTAGDLVLRARAAATPLFEEMTLEEVEKHLIQRALARNPNVSDAARALGLSRSALYRRLQHFGLSGPSSS
jgi:transcriptional regulator of acetoin/glycerol metabolism